MTANDTAHNLNREIRQRMEQIEVILRRLNPELTEAQTDELMLQFLQWSGFSDG